MIALHIFKLPNNFLNQLYNVWDMMVPQYNCLNNRNISISKNTVKKEEERRRIEKKLFNILSLNANSYKKSFLKIVTLAVK